MKRFAQFFIEKRVLGLVENLDLEDIGIVSAKLDSGNGAYNVLHGEDIMMDDSVARFTTINNIVIEKPIVETITINVGAGNTEDRPVVHFTVGVGDQVFDNVPFSIGNRSTNEHKVLVGKQFIQQQLDALIDVGLNNVAADNMEVGPVTA